jgi:hypothetical protein
MARKPSNRVWNYSFRGQVLTIAANKAGNGYRSVLLDGEPVGHIERAYFTPSLTTWAVGEPWGHISEQYPTMREAAEELCRRATRAPSLQPADDEIVQLTCAGCGVGVLTKWKYISVPGDTRCQACEVARTYDDVPALS